MLTRTKFIIWAIFLIVEAPAAFLFTRPITNAFISAWLPRVLEPGISVALAVDDRMLPHF